MADLQLCSCVFILPLFSTVAFHGMYESGNSATIATSDTFAGFWDYHSLLLWNFSVQSFHK